ncbi:hypothetical protein Micbo1qcDRAFT_141987, partial [Microdochium bolleyi]
MELSGQYIYALTLCGILLILFVVRQILSVAYTWCRIIFLLFLRLFSYTFVIHRHRWLGPWTIDLIFSRTIYLVANLLCLLMPSVSRAELASRAGSLAAINITPLFLSIHLDFLADALGQPLGTIQEVHKSAGVMTFALLTLHVCLLVDLEAVPGLYVMMASISAAVMVLLGMTPLRRRLHELADKSHKALAITMAFSTWQHISTITHVHQWLLYTAAGVICLVHAVQVCLFLRRNVCWGKPFPRAHVTSDGSIVRIVLCLPRPVKIDAGQYISLSMISSTIGFWSWVQSHPFTITSWSLRRQDELELCVQCRSGLTLRLLQSGERTFLAFFSGPHGRSHSLKAAKSVLMLTTDFGIVAVLPYLKKITVNYECRVHMVWHVKRLSDFAPLVTLLNEYLRDHTLRNVRRILQISVYNERGVHNEGFGYHGRVNMLACAPDIADIMKSEVDGEFITEL